ncbi:aspartate--ammonia ligase [Fusobacterium sp. PH5-44]|uniref:aspartate--ammonia ligase n=1 Tax=unclassified Fusobacterium TaxID=2648384 RepID=UPI003D26162B
MEYVSKLSIIETEIAIKKIKDFFEDGLAAALDLTRVSAPLFVTPESGLNDNLNGVERPVSFDTLVGVNMEIIHSLAKWKRMALYKYGFDVGKGLYTDMNAIRRDEEVDQIHSYYVDQWDWEKIIRKEDRTEATLKSLVDSIYAVLLELENYVHSLYPNIDHKLPKNITYITTQELEDKYPDFTAKERENAIAKEFGAVFIMKIGGILNSGEKHDGRAPDYDDWNLNGDIILYNKILDSAFELSSMGIRVDEDTLINQLKITGCTDRVSQEFHSLLLDKKLPYTVGGGIGQSRICMYFLDKSHIGEVQASVWPKEEIEKCKKLGIHLL